jgi:hypothetical protein
MGNRWFGDQGEVVARRSRSASISALRATR